MGIDKYFFVAGCLSLIIYFLIKNKKSRLTLVLPFLGVFFLFAPSLFPASFFGKWDAISNVENEKVESIILKPSQPHYGCNLVGTVVKIENRSRINKLLTLLHNSEMYSPNHALTIWEVDVILVKGATDSIALRVEKLENGETVIYSKWGNYQNNALAENLEAITKFNKPLKGK